jgi:hypothetical protein
MPSPSDTQMPPTSSLRPISGGRLPPRLVPVLRGAWVVCALLLLGNFLASIPGYYQIMSTVCPQENQGDCTGNFGQLTESTVQTLTSLHLSLNGYAVYFVLANVLVSLLTWGIGLLIFWRKSDEWMGLFVSLLLILFGGNGVSNTLSGLWMPSPPTPLFSTLLEVISGAQWIGMGLFLLTFPTGRFAPRWSWIILSFWILAFLQPSSPAFLPIVSPAVEGLVFLLEGLVVFGGTLYILVYRYRRVFDAGQRQQTKWVVYAVAAWVTMYILGTSLAHILPATSPLQLLFPTLTLVLPSAILYLGLGFAILRYRLWDIDAIINRTLVYGTLTAILTLTYVGLILLLQALSQALTGTPRDQPLVIVGSTLLIIALFNPLRRRLQTFIDRRFYRRKYDAVKILAAFTSSLRTEVDLTNLSSHLVQVVEETMQPTQVSLWLRSPGPDRTPGVLWRAPLLHQEHEQA